MNSLLKKIIISAFFPPLLFLQAAGYTPATKKTVAQFLKMSNRDTTVCELTGVVSRVRNYERGRLFLDDGTGSVLIYNVYDAVNKRHFPETDVREGDTLTVIGKRFVYDGRVIEMKNALYLTHKEGPDHKSVIKRDRLDKEPSFRGKGTEEFSKWVSAHLKYPKAARDAYGDGTVIVKFIVGMDGSILEPTIVQGSHKALNEEVIRVLKKAPKWKPGEVDNHPVRVNMTMPVVFIMDI